mmetsp:Transcript_7081/g.19788  ORF Transcript_7081/g.19788 Transcript_7081/m.19788 type:complete len:138 (+) Transcript_7081:435-848(+)
MSIRTNPPQPTVSVKIIRYTSEAPFSVELRQRGAPSGWECHQTDTDKVTRKRRQLQTHQCFETNDRVHPTNGHVPYSFPQRGSVAFVGAESSAPRRTGRGGERSGQVLIIVVVLRQNMPCTMSKIRRQKKSIRRPPS